MTGEGGLCRATTASFVAPLIYKWQFARRRQREPKSTDACAVAVSALIGPATQSREPLRTFRQVMQVISSDYQIIGQTIIPPCGPDFFQLRCVDLRVTRREVLE